MSRGATPSRILIEVSALTALAAGATLLILRWDVAWLRSNRGLLIAAVWLYLPLLAAWAGRIEFEDLGLRRPPVFASLALVILGVLITYPPFYLAWWILQTHYFGKTFSFAWPPALLNLVMAQTLAIALPEEVFFRGYLQARLNLVFGRPWKLWSASLGPGLFLTALVFMFCHLLISITWIRVAILFPALLFGWMRERTNSILAPVLFHALSNLTFFIAQAGVH